MTRRIRALERQLGRLLFLRYARGVTLTTIGDELAHKAAPHLDALTKITEAGLDRDSVTRTGHHRPAPQRTAHRHSAVRRGARTDRAPLWAGRLVGPAVLEAGGAWALGPVPLVEVHESLPLSVALLDPPVPPLRTSFLAVRTGTLGLPHIARAQEWLLRAAVAW